MAQNSKIEWTHHTDNLWHGCTRVHAGCDHCYAETLSHRWGRDVWGADKPRLDVKSVWNDLWKQQTLAAATGQMHRVFVGSMMDIFEKPMPLIDREGKDFGCTTGDKRSALFGQISEGYYPNLIFLFLTKRPGNINKYIPEIWKESPPENVMFGTSISDQETANILIPQLIKVNGKRFLSYEPALGPVDLEKWISPCGYYCSHSDKDFSAFCESDEFNEMDEPNRSLACSFFYKNNHRPDKSNIDWVIIGGESGHHKRPFDCGWARTVRDQCKDAGVPFFMKQVDKIKPIPENLMIREFPDIKMTA